MSSVLPDDDTRHGLNGYNNLGCRCVRCRKAAAKYAKERQRERWEQTARYGPPPNLKHGYSGYRNWGCHCDVCIAANRDQTKKARERKRRG